MIGLIVAGHGEFARGLADTVRMLAGELEHVVCVDFPAGMAGEELEQHLLTAADFMSACNRFVILTDLPGGTPFRIAAGLALRDDRFRVLTGTNVPLLLQLALSRTGDACVDELIASALAEARQAVMVFEVPKPW
ncbi:MAG TPA: PTS sugar transporter subunit IIA [Clostridiales bacterium]|nr:PTS sugar transporter subunit IIA [Clostridiales bacterium]